ncbi:MAG: L-serine ammonia-lyase, iron-sulfur-dependent, subunit alpha [Oscillospiraceae bacterium]|nr:L-serine ammonia-lyase, iron-sulfur-dependent, subunit alpha [Oscillospiraceae bacterium]
MKIHYNDMKNIINLACQENKRISELIIKDTADDIEKTEEEVFKMMEENWFIMKKSIENGLNNQDKSLSGLTGDMAKTFKNYYDNKESISGSFFGEIIYSALAVAEENATMGRIVSCPTAGSCGIMPGVLIALQNKYSIDDKKIVFGLFNAAAIGKVISKKASVAGAVGGCQVECGTALAMAASALVEIMGGSPEMCGHAAAQALKSIMGLICDPVAGLVEEPCIIRNATLAGLAPICADLALSGIKSIIPIDEVIIAMNDVSNMMPYQLKETALGGIATSATAKEIEKKLQ